LLLSLFDSKEFWNSSPLCKERANLDFYGKFFEITAFLRKKTTGFLGWPNEIF